MSYAVINLETAKIIEVLDYYKLAEVDGPVAKARAIFNKNPGKSKEKLLKLCAKAGINPFTASGRYYHCVHNKVHH